MTLEYMLCPEGHAVPYATWNFAKEVSEDEVDATTLQPTSEPGLYCLGCERAYGLSKLKRPDSDH